jgi:CrcB protein
VCATAIRVEVGSIVQLLWQIALVALGSAIGGVTRWGVNLAFAKMLGTRFPWGTFLINVTGCFFLGWFLTYLTDRTAWKADNLRLLIAVGFTGAYTTFSTYGYEGDRLLHNGDTVLGLLYIIGSVVLGLLAVRAGVYVAKW